jgi:hypothetical protein
MLRSNTDILELYSFVIQLYSYSMYFKYIMKYNIFIILTIKSITILSSYFLFHHNLLGFFRHKYLINNTFDVAVPQTINCLFNVYMNNREFALDNNFNSLILVPANASILYFIHNAFPSESDKSRKLRYYLTFIFFFVALFWY